MHKSRNEKLRSRRRRQRAEHWRLRSLSITSLIGMALQEWDSETRWDAIHELRFRGTPETVARCQQLFRSRNWRKRELAVDVMCQLRTRPVGRKSEDYAVLQSHALLREALRDRAHRVVAAAAFGCGHRKGLDAIEILITLVTHVCDRVRWGTAFGLCLREDERAVAALIQLAGDRNDDVRNWATFGLAEVEIDNFSIRECLWRNTLDTFDEVRDEALRGLANRGDARVADPVSPLVEERRV
jgi:HEAT repeat protein